MLLRETKSLEGKKHFEVSEYCKCESCNIRSLKRLHTKKVYIYFENINKKSEAEEIIKNFKCDQVYNNNSAFESHEIHYI